MHPQSLRIPVLTIDLCRSLLLFALLFAVVALFAKLAYLAASVPVIEIKPEWQLTRSGRNAILIARLMNMMPQAVRFFVIMCPSVVLLLVTTPSLFSFLCRIKNRHRVAYLSASGMESLRDCAIHHVPWSDFDKLQLIRPSRPWRKHHLTIILSFQNRNHVRQTPTLREWLIHVLSLNWVQGIKVRVVVPDNRLTLSTAMHNFDPRSVMSLIKLYRPDLVERLPVENTSDHLHMTKQN